MNQHERMLAGLPFLAEDEDLVRLRMNCKMKLFRYNRLPPDHVPGRSALLREILGKCGRNVHIESPFHCDYGTNIEVGENFYANFNLVILDVARVRIGANVFVAPNVGIYSAGHPVHPEARNSGYEYGRSITIGDNVWLGGNVVVNPGLSIGDNVVIGSGSVLVRDIPANVVAAGNPARIIREITSEDKKYYFGRLPFDVCYWERSEKP